MRVEHLPDPLGITVRQPRLSWQLPAGSRRQVAYRIRADGWDSGRVESDQSVLVRYGGPPARSGRRVEWQVQVWTDAGRSDWSAPGWWEAGLLEAGDWTARFIEPDEAEDVRDRTPRPAYLFRHSFTLAGEVKKARLYATAHGVYECHINGRRVGDMELTPGFTSYGSILQVQAFDVTGLLEPGENVVGAIVSDGWFRGQVSGFRLTNLYGDSVALLAQLDVTQDNGSVTSIGTGPDWEVGTGAITEADLYQGQRIDLRHARPGWSAPSGAFTGAIGPGATDTDAAGAGGTDTDGTATGGGDHGWAGVRVRDHDLSRLTSSPAPPVRRVEELRPIAVTQPRPDRQVIDLGRNINGWIRLESLGPAGTELTLTHGEALDPDGDVTQANLVPDPEANQDLQDPEFANLALPLQVDSVVSSGRPGEFFEPRHTTHGFRYVRVEGHPGTIEPDQATGVVVHTALRPTGSFTCSDERINALHDAAMWSFRGNACDIPTDCPTRERAGWTGDWQIFAPTAAFLYDVAGFSTKWLRDLAAEQQSDGLVLHCVPETMSMRALKKIGAPPGSSGWGDAAVIVPWETYRAYADVDVLAEQWPSMTAWVEYAARAAREHRHPDRVAARPEPAVHEEFLWDSGYHWGEWLEPDVWEPNIISTLAVADHGAVATAYLHYSASLLARIAGILGRDDDAVRYRNLAAATRAAWQTEFIRGDGTLAPDTQATYVRALAFGLVPDESRPQMAQRLVELIRKAGTHLGTGFLATPYLLPVLADAGHLDIAYEVLFQDTPPSWLTMVDRGATTIWEDWNGVSENGIPYLSLNHYSKGAVVSFLHRYTGGIQLLDDHPGYRHFRIAPRPGGGITSACVTHQSPYGSIKVSWRLDGERFQMEVSVPPGATADVRLPTGSDLQAAPGTSYYECRHEAGA
nr:alpha-L-rhamnosidase [Phytoactinopolyspora alkaliphila]